MADSRSSKWVDYFPMMLVVLMVALLLAPAVKTIIENASRSSSDTGTGADSEVSGDEFYLTVDTIYCSNPNHCYLCGQVTNLNESQVMTNAGFSEDEKQIYQVYCDQIRAMGG